jgi:hypothetical protein
MKVTRILAHQNFIGDEEGMSLAVNQCMFEMR